MGPWFRIAGIQGMFNPIVHEPIVASGLLSFELPFVMSHELAHVRGYPDEGDANLAALLATVSSDDPRFQYSGWFHLWLYLRTPELDSLLDDGPRLDLQLVSLRIETQQIRWVSNFQTAMLDLFLKANDVDEGVHELCAFRDGRDCQPREVDGIPLSRQVERGATTGVFRRRQPAHPAHPARTGHKSD